MHQVVDLKVLYFGTPVVLISTQDAHGTANLAPMSSAWWLGDTAILGMGNSSQTAANLRRTRECVLNLPSPELVGAVDRMAMLTGAQPVPERKAAQGYRHSPDKFAAAGLTRQRSTLVKPPRVQECPIQLECELTATHALSDQGPNATAFQVRVLRSHVASDLVIPGTDYIDPETWDPLIMKFTEFFGGGMNVHSSRLSAGWSMPHRLPGAAKV